MRSELTSLQADIVDRLKDDEALAGVEIIHQDDGDIGNTLANALARLKGVYVLVMTAGASVDNPSMPGPYLDNITIEIECGERVVLNRSAAGSGITALQLAEHVLARLHHWTPTGGGACFYAQSLRAVEPPKGADVAYMARISASDGIDNTN